MNMKSLLSKALAWKEPPVAGENYSVVLPRMPIEKALLHQLVPQATWDDSIFDCQSSSDDSEFPYCHYIRTDVNYRSRVAPYFECLGPATVVSNWGDISVLESWSSICGRYGPADSKWSVSLCVYNCHVYLVTLLTLHESEATWHDANGDEKKAVLGSEYYIVARSIGENSLPALKINFNRLAKLVDKRWSVGRDSPIKNELFEVKPKLYPELMTLADKWNEFLDSASDTFRQIPIAEFRTTDMKSTNPFLYTWMKLRSFCTLCMHDPDDYKLNIYENEEDQSSGTPKRVYEIEAENKPKNSIENPLEGVTAD